MKVLYWGHEEWAPIPYYRGQQFRDYWPRYGVQMAYVRYADFDRAALDWGPIDWADVVVFHRWYEQPEAPLAWARAGLMGKARVYDTDDWDFGTPTRIKFRATIMQYIDLVAQMAREADVVTVATPALVTKYSQYSRKPPIVVRNAVDRRLFVNGVEPPDRPSAVFYGSRYRLPDYFGSADARGRWKGGYAHAATADARIPVTWVGDDQPAEPVPLEFSKVMPYDYDLRGFARVLTETHGIMGLAPLAEDSFNACKSELHWLDYTAAGMPTVAQRMSGPSPYDVIRDGQDGLLAKGRDEWSKAVARLAKEPNLRSDLVQAAQERIDTEYHPQKRAGEWAAVFSTASQ